MSGNNVGWVPKTIVPQIIFVISIKGGSHRFIKVITEVKVVQALVEISCTNRLQGKVLLYNATTGVKNDIVNSRN